MLILSQNGLVYLATPKTGSTAIEQTLGNLADIRFSRRRKHQNARFYHNRVAPFLKASLNETNEVIAVIREPMDWLRSWYRYRVRLPKDNPRSTDGVSFHDFARAALQSPQPPLGTVGRQFNFLSADDGTVLVDHLFAYEEQPVLRQFLDERFETSLNFPTVNVSRPLLIEEIPQTEADVRAAWPEDFALYDQVMAAGGHLRCR